MEKLPNVEKVQCDLVEGPSCRIAAEVVKSLKLFKTKSSICATVQRKARLARMRLFQDHKAAGTASEDRVLEMSIKYQVQVLYQEREQRMPSSVCNK